MNHARRLLEEIRKELSGLNEEITGHAFIADAEAGRLPLDRLRLFAENQLYIVSHDARSLARMTAGARSIEEASYFSRLLEGDLSALRSLGELGEELGVRPGDLYSLRLIPEAVAYTHYLAWLSCYANPGEQALALIVNLPVWGAACARLGRALSTRYGVKRTVFLDSFASIPGWVEEEGLGIAEKYLPSSEGAMRVAARMIQRYEKLFWDALYSYPLTHPGA